MAAMSFVVRPRITRCATPASVAGKAWNTRAILDDSDEVRVLRLVSIRLTYYTAALSRGTSRASFATCGITSVLICCSSSSLRASLDCSTLPSSKQQAEWVGELQEQVQRLEESVKGLQPQLGRTEALAEDLKQQVELLRRDYKEIAEVLRGV